MNCGAPGFKPMTDSSPLVYNGERRFRTLLDKLHAGAYTCDPDGLITYYNNCALGIWGRAPKLRSAEDRYCGSFRLYAADGAPLKHDECWMALAIRHRRPYNGREIVVERPDGTRVAALAHANPITDASGRLVGAVNVLIDISDRKMTEEVLRRADRARTEFLAVMSHELRNPLAPMAMIVPLLEKRCSEDPEALHLVGILRRQTSHMTRLVNDLLDVARIDRGSLRVEKSHLELRAIIESALETSAVNMAERGHEVRFRAPDESIWLYADGVRLAQAIANLLNNAAKFTPSGGLVTVTLEREQGYAVIRVSDNGVGISKEALPGIFTMFRRGNESDKAAYNGLGIGLSLVRNLVQLHGGTVEAASAGPGCGSEFTIRLPPSLSPCTID